ncbi:hypothetical protein BH23DEI1_BH23DEI1_05600 [soil metagenome]|nr:SRPBCC domain-containing protein [Trueperaceae bacterium]
MLVTVSFEPSANDGTLMRLVHERLPDADQQARHEQGWTGSFARLEGYVGVAG